ncbi:MAG: acetyl-CoA carboxylase carboxyl transferase subunit alpha [Candidatus Hydrothermota bacterium]|nr:MAG: acetyl-CoA carboxylase carboxyl transferase subunit alpha [Candidatus Hydrothermae bacterium]
MGITLLDFEKPIYEIEKRIKELSELIDEHPELKEELEALTKRAELIKKRVYSSLSRWQKVQLARHPDRPHAIDYITGMTDDFIELHGDRLYGDDPSIIAGLAKIEGIKVVIIGQEKGRDVHEKVYRNFGMPHPEGYRKAKRVMKLGERFNLPVVSIVDTPGAYPGIGAEERGQAMAIAENLEFMLGLKTPIVVAVIGEGGSGGALAIAVGDVVLAMEYSIYSVISPEGCAAILWRDGKLAPKAAEALKLTAKDLYELGVIDEIVPEPLGGAHRDHATAINNLKTAILKHLRNLMKLDKNELLKRRHEKYRKIGYFKEE